MDILKCSKNGLKMVKVNVKFRDEYCTTKQFYFFMIPSCDSFVEKIINYGMTSIQIILKSDLLFPGLEKNSTFSTKEPAHFFGGVFNFLNIFWFVIVFVSC